jgi:hypothetical protein
MASNGAATQEREKENTMSNATTRTAAATNEKAASISSNSDGDDKNENSNVIATSVSREDQRRHIRIARYPVGTFLLDSLHLLSPWTWAGLATNRKMLNGISIFTTAWQSFWGILLPGVFYKMTFEVTSFLQRRLSATSIPGSAVTAAQAIASRQSAIATAAAASSSSSSSLSDFVAAFCSASLPSPKQLLLAYLLSPWTMAWLLRGVGPVVQATMAVATARSMHRRTRALPEAWQVLSDAIETGRAYRTRKYDTYLPLIAGKPDPSCVAASVPALSNTVSMDNQQQQQQQPQPYDSVILFIPGSGLDPTGYAAPAKMLSDCGHVVIVVSSEPLRMAWPSLGFTAAYGKRLMRQVNRELNAKLLLPQQQQRQPQHRPSPTSASRKSLATTQPQEAERTFHLTGHSLGAFTASHWVQGINTTKLILWAAVPAFSEFLHDLRSNKNDNNDDDALQVLVLQASNDGIRQFMMETTAPDVLAERTKTFWQRLPKGGARGNVQQRLLVGATHNGFGSHEAGYFLTNPENQGISRLQQQQQAVAWTHEFIVGRQQQQQE